MINNLMRYPTVILKNIKVLSATDLRYFLSNGLFHAYS